MTTAAVSEIKARLSEYLRRVRGGEEVVVTDRGRPIARIVPVFDPDAHLGDLDQRGLLRPPVLELPANFLERDRPPIEGGSLVDAVIEERREGR
jgi:prevent-host-death family protein